ncbi:hypothetical protein FBZ94_104193 [Bradyrhizobium sacchari]|uniref:Uncharacterized protein n=1 Tax=Bradyrhizobium sacchari TaxID=1399419 RepID=A0A560ITZ0_9BRAD|nr:hypothetical protein FBZ94_104193 [Bradyrhizobium sacchari]TWB74221.1 hypothetical protein FBZ95_105473 [Bradyrhizobium sacchari]
MRAERAAISARLMPLSLILRRPLETVVSKDEALAQAAAFKRRGEEYRHDSAPGENQARFVQAVT